MFVPPAIIARLCAIALHLSALTLRTCIFNPIMAMAGRRSGATPLQHLGCGNAYVHCLLRRVCVLGAANGECFVRSVLFCVPGMREFIITCAEPFCRLVLSRIAFEDKRGLAVSALSGLALFRFCFFFRLS